jgi:hypothetical protein
VATTVEPPGDDSTATTATWHVTAPLGFLGAGEALRYLPLSAFFLFVCALMTLGALAFATVLLRNSSALDVVSMPDAAHG